MERTLFGRQTELARISTRLDAVPSGPTALVLGGEAGIGKSRLMREFARYARSRGLHTLAARCFEIERAMAYQPVIDLVAQALEADACFVYLYDERPDELVLRATHGTPIDDMSRRPRMPPGAGIPASAAAARAPAAARASTTSVQNRFAPLSIRATRFHILPLLRLHCNIRPGPGAGSLAALSASFGRATMLT